MKTLVIGAGMYGSTIALKLADSGFEVDLAEKESDIMQVATPITLRAHAGYFYARSPETMLTCKESSARFRKAYPKGTIDGSTHYYAIAKEGSKITGKAFLETLDKHGLSYKKATEPLLKEELVDVTIAVDEYSYDPEALRNEVKTRLAQSSVKLLLNTDATDIDHSQYGLIIIASYAGNNDAARAITGEPIQEYEYRFCEKVVVKLPTAFHKKNFVVLDGPFFQIDPLGSQEGVFALSNFTHSIHSRYEGTAFEMDEQKRSVLGKGLVKNPPLTNGPEIIESIRPFIPEIEKAEIIGSLFAVKPVLPRESTDARPVLIKAIRPNVLSVLSGKVSGCIQAADECLAYAQKMSA